MQYQVGGSLTTDAPSYIERRADDDFVGALQQGEFCYVLNSRQMGKSSLMVRSHQKFTRMGYRCAVLDMTNIGSENITPLQWYKGIVKDLWRSFKLTRKADFTFKAWWQDEEDISLLQRLSQFIKDVLLTQFPDEEIVIFVDEVDSILSLPFPVDDFFALVRFCYNQRAIDPAYKRIHFAIFGVATPADLIRDRKRTPFNIGTPIYLNGFTQDEVQPLAQGLTVQKGDAAAVLKAILSWTDGQPFLTQKLCQLAISSSQGAASQPLTIPPGNEAYWVESLVQSKIVDRWESQDEPEHLRTIRNRILSSPERAGRLLSIYQRVLEGEAEGENKGAAEEENKNEAEGENKSEAKRETKVAVLADDSREQIELVLSGLVTKKEGRLCVKNRIYAEIFDLAWVTHQLSQLRPYAQQFDAWVASQKNDESRLLRGQSLKDAQLWSQGKQLSDLDYQYLAASVESDRTAVQQSLEAARVQAVEAQLVQKQQAVTFQRRFLGALGAALAMAVGFGANTFVQYRQTQISEIRAIAMAAEGRFESHHQLEALQQIVTAATKLKGLWHPPADLSQQVQQVLHKIVDGTAAKNQLELGTALSPPEIHPSGRFIAVITTDGNVSFWQPDGQPAQVPIELPGPVHSVAFSPKGDRIAVTLKNNHVQLWSLEGNLIQTFTNIDWASRQLSFSPEGNQLVLEGNKENPLTVLDLDDGSLTSLPAKVSVTSHLFSADGAFIVGVQSVPPGHKLQGGPVRPRRIRPGNPLPGNPLQSGPPRSGQASGPPPLGMPPQQSPNNIRKHDLAYDEFYSAEGHPRSLVVWDRAGNVVDSFPGGDGLILEIASHPSQNIIAAVSRNGMVSLKDLDKDTLQPLLVQDAQISAIAFSPDGQQIVAGDTDGVIHFWTINGSLIKRLEGHQGLIAGLAFSPDGQWLASTSDDGTVRLWTPEHPMHTTLAAHRHGIVDVAFVGDALWSFSPGSQLYTWARGAGGSFLPRPQKNITSIVSHLGLDVSEDGNTVATNISSHKISITDATGSLMQTLEPPVSTSERMVYALSRKGRYLAVGNRGLQIYEKTAAGQFVQSPHATVMPEALSITKLAWNADESQLAVATQSGLIQLWQVSPEAELNLVKLNLVNTWDTQLEAIQQLTFSPDGRLLAFSNDNTHNIHIWAIEDARSIQTLVGHKASIQDLAFRGDGQQLASASADRTVKVWQVRDPAAGPAPEQDALQQTALLRTLTGYQGKVRALAFSPDGKALATGSVDRDVRVWQLAELLAQDDLAYACGRVRDYLQRHPQVEPEARSLCD